jgi:hypothetical protein
MPTAILEPCRQVIKTPMLRVPRHDWAAITTGAKRQFRICGRGNPPTFTKHLPTPVVLHSQTQFQTQPRTCMGVVEEVRREPLGAISPEDLEAEGFQTLAEFRRYWIDRHEYSVGFKPLSIVGVYTVRPWREGDRELFGEALLTYLFGQWL